LCVHKKGRDTSSANISPVSERAAFPANYFFQTRRSGQRRKFPFTRWNKTYIRCSQQQQQQRRKEPTNRFYKLSKKLGRLNFVYRSMATAAAAQDSNKCGQVRVFQVGGHRERRERSA